MPNASQNIFYCLQPGINQSSEYYYIILYVRAMEQSAGNCSSYLHCATIEFIVFCIQYLAAPNRYGLAKKKKKCRLAVAHTPRAGFQNAAKKFEYNISRKI